MKQEKQIKETVSRKKKFDENAPFPSRLRELLGVNDDKQKDTSRGAFKKLADDLGISVPTISQYASGMIAPNYDNLIKIAKYFHVSTDYLCGLTEQPTDNPDEAAAAAYTGLYPESVRALHYINCLRDDSPEKKALSFLNRELHSEWNEIEQRRKSAFLDFESLFEALEDYVVGSGESGYYNIRGWQLNIDELFRDKALERAEKRLKDLSEKAGIVLDTILKTEMAREDELLKKAVDMAKKEQEASVVLHEALDVSPEKVHSILCKLLGFNPENIPDLTEEGRRELEAEIASLSHSNTEE